MENRKTVACIQCGVCMHVCSHGLSPIIIKEAMDKQNFVQLLKLHAEMCEGCSECNFNCPSRIDLRRSFLMAKASLRYLSKREKAGVWA